MADVSATSLNVSHVAGYSASNEHDVQSALLILEQRHRLKNLLAIVQAIVVQTLAHAADTRSATARIVERISALARCQDLVMAEIMFNPPFRSVVAAATKPFELWQGRIQVDGPDLTVRGSTALGLSLVLHELATNAVKYGALSTRHGGVRLCWAIKSGDLHILWQEHGGPAAAAPTQSGFGSQLILRALAGEHRASSVTYEPTGLVWKFSAPLDDLLA